MSGMSCAYLCISVHVCFGPACPVRFQLSIDTRMDVSQNGTPRRHPDIPWRAPDALLKWWLPNGWDHAGGWLGHHHWGMFWILLLHHGLHRPSDSQSLGCQTWLQCLQWNSLLHPALCWQRLNHVKPFNLPQTTHNKGEIQASKPISLHGHFPTFAFAKGCDFTWASKAVEWNVRLAVQRAARLCQWIHLGLRGSSLGSSGLWRDATSALATCRIFLAAPWDFLGNWEIPNLFSCEMEEKVVDQLQRSLSKPLKTWMAMRCYEYGWVWKPLKIFKNCNQKNRPDAVRPPESCTSDEPLPIHLQLGQVAKWQRRCPDDGPGWRPHVPCLQGSAMKWYE